MSDSAISLRAFSVISAEGELLPASPDGWTVERAWRELLLPELTALRRGPVTIGEYCTHVRRWGEFCTAALAGELPSGYRISNPVLGEITRRTLEEFRTYVKSTVCPCTDRTANKHVDSILRILRCAEGHEGVELAGVPSVRRLEHRPTKRKLYFTYDQVDALYRACEVATWPHKDRKGKPLTKSPAEQWQAAIVLYFSYGFRTRELIAHLRRNRPLIWANVTFDCHTPSDEGHAENEHGWLVYVPKKQERFKPQPLVLPLSEVAKAHLKSLRRPGVRGEDAVFDWPLKSDLFYDQWERIVAAAGVRPKPCARTGKPGSFHVEHFRKTCETWYATHFNKPTAEAIVGHAARDVSGQHYINMERQLVHAVNHLPLPESFQAIFATGNRQLALF